MKYITPIIIFYSFVASTAFADSEIPPFPKVDKPSDGSCYIKQIPAKLRYITDQNHMVIGTETVEDAFVNAYKILANGKDEFLWSSVGWYANQVFLSDDCQYLVRMGNWARGSEPSSEDLAVAFYKNGEMLLSYSTADLIEKNKSVVVTTGHYFWLSEGKESLRFEQWSDTLYLKTIEEKELRFNYKTGMLKNH